jgi:hypothetical protein
MAFERNGYEPTAFQITHVMTVVGGVVPLSSLTYRSSTSMKVVGSVPVPQLTTRFDGTRIQGNVPTPTLVARISTNTIRISGTLPPPKLTYGDKQGSLMSVAAGIVPTSGLAYSAYSASSMAVAGNVPISELEMFLRLSSVIQCIVANLDNAAISEYGLSFNSIAEFGGVVLVADSSGVYALDANDDLDEDIEAHILTAYDDIGLIEWKRILDIYLSVITDGEMALRAYYDGKPSSEIKTSLQDTALIKTMKADGHKGLMGKYLALRVANTKGKDFLLDMVDFGTAYSKRNYGK